MMTEREVAAEVCWHCGEAATNEDFCYGCGVYVCNECSLNYELPPGSHEPEAHLRDPLDSEVPQ